jgi:hypothetical protein
MTRILNSEAVAERARNLGTFNGVKLAFVSLMPAGAPTFAWLDVEFYNANHLSPLPAVGSFAIVGGTRVIGGSGAGQVKVTQVLAGANPTSLRLKVEPIGDYSTYTLRVPATGFDPLLRELPFKFRPGCFNLNCAPDWAPGEARPPEPTIDYLARDYDSFRHVLMTALAERVPGWEPTSEADLDQVLIDLIAADADEIADYQDRVGNEAFIATARKRLTLARQARLMDYHIHQGNQGSTWLAVQVSVDDTLPKDFGVWAGDHWMDPDAVIFAGAHDTKCFALLNAFGLYSWDESVTALEVGSTEADLSFPGMTQAQAIQVRDLLLGPDVDRILIQQELNPETGSVNGVDVHARQVLQLLPRDSTVPRAEVVEDPVHTPSNWMVRVRWLPEDRLLQRYCFITECQGNKIDNVSSFYGNLVWVTHGRPWRTTFKAPGSPLAGLDKSQFVGTDESVYELTLPADDKPKWGVLCPLTQAPLAYLETTPGGEKPTRTSLSAEVSGFAAPWIEQSDLIESQAGDPHFIVETDEYGRSEVRFGNGVNGRALPDGATVTCRYRVGQGVAGNVGCDTLTHFDAAALPSVTALWNPLDVVNGREPEPVAQIQRRVPEAYRQRQLRAVTLEDYAARAEELPEVSHARARYAWTGSWRTVRVAIDPAGTTTLTRQVARKIEDYLDAVRLIGEDLEIRPAVYVPLDIELRVCAASDYWPEDLRAELEQEFSDGYTPDGRRGFFHPDLWTFGQPLYASQIIGRALAVQGVDRVLLLSMRRWNPGAGGGLTTIVINPDDLPKAVINKLEVGPFEIVQVANDPSRLETGRMTFDILGGRR